MDGDKVLAVIVSLVIGAIVLYFNINILNMIIPSWPIREGWEFRLFLAVTSMVLVVVYFALDVIFRNVNRRYHYRRARKG